MKSFLGKTLSFLTVLILLSLCGQALISWKANGVNTTGHDNLELTTAVDAGLVFLGSSRCRSHFDPSFFERQFNIKSINLGVDGHSEISMAYNRLKDYLAHNKSPKYVILSIDPLISSGNFNGPTANRVSKDAFAKYAFSPFNHQWKVVNHFGFTTTERLVPLYSLFKYRQLTNILLFSKSSSFSKNRYDRHDEAWNNSTEEIEWDKIFFENSELDEVQFALKKMDLLCKSENIQLICLQTPVHQSIFDSEKFQKTQLICQKLDIPFFDLNIEEIRKNKNFFYNSDHLNTNGVRRMNKYIEANDELITLLASKNSKILYSQ